MPDLLQSSIDMIEKTPLFLAVEKNPIDPPYDLNDLIDNPFGETLTFAVASNTQAAFPPGVVLTPEGLLQGTPQEKTAGGYEVTLLVQSQTVKPDSNELVYAPTEWTVGLRVFNALEYEVFDKAVETAYAPPKNDQKRLGLDTYWKRLQEKLPVADLENILTREVLASDIEYLLSRYAALTVWNADDLSLAKTGKLISLPEASTLYHVYDFGSAIVATPLDLYDPKRTLQDSIQTAKAVAHEASRRGWNVELSGYDKMKRAVWIEIQSINKTLRAKAEGKLLEVRDYEPSEADYKTLEISPE